MYTHTQWSLRDRVDDAIRQKTISSLPVMFVGNNVKSLASCSCCCCCLLSNEEKQVERSAYIGLVQEALTWHVSSYFEGGKQTTMTVAGFQISKWPCAMCNITILFTRKCRTGLFPRKKAEWIYERPIGNDLGTPDLIVFFIRREIHKVSLFPVPAVLTKNTKRTWIALADKAVQFCPKHIPWYKLMIHWSYYMWT